MVAKNVATKKKITDAKRPIHNFLISPLLPLSLLQLEVGFSLFLVTNVHKHTEHNIFTYSSSVTVSTQKSHTRTSYSYPMAGMVVRPSLQLPHIALPHFLQ